MAALDRRLGARTGAASGARLRPGAFVLGALLAGAVGLLSPSAGAARISSAAAATARADVILSNETTFTRWAVASRHAVIRRQPSKTAPAITKLSFWTPDGFSQSYILLREHWTGRHAWVKLRIPDRPNGRVGWVPRNALQQLTVTHMEIVVNRAARRLTLYRRGTAIFHAPVGVGKPSTPTPAGHFWITEAFPSSDPAYGPYAFGTSDYSVLSDWPGGGIIGLHGTDQPQLVPGDPSHGCIRLHNSDILKLSHLVKIGTPLLIK